MSKPLVSVLITSYNREDYIASALQSVLQSTYENIEVLVADDGSTDNTYEIIQAFEKKDSRVRGYRNRENRGQFQNRNYVASLARGTYLKYVDSDDYLYPHGISIMMYYAMRFPDAALIVSSSVYADTIPFPIKLSPHEAYTRFYLAGRFPSVGPSAMLIRKDVFDSLNGFTIPSFVGSDTEFMLKLAARSAIVETEPAVIWYRVHEGQEMTKGVKSGEYEMYEYPVYSKLLQAAECPLKGAENDQALKKLRKRNARFILRYLKRANFRFARILYLQLNPTLGEMWAALFN